MFKERRVYINKLIHVGRPTEKKNLETEDMIELFKPDRFSKTLILLFVLSSLLKNV